MSDKLSVTFSPHLQDNSSIQSMSRATFYALIPAMLLGIYWFGLRALIIMILSVVSAMAADAFLMKRQGRPANLNDGTAALIGLLLALLLPAGSPWWAVIIGSAMAIFLGRALYGGLGGNPFNAVLVGWVVMKLSWPASVTQYVETMPLFQGFGQLVPLDPTELPLGLLDYGSLGQAMDTYGWWPVLIGNIPGGIGSTSALAIGLAGLYLLKKRVIPWQIPVGYLGGMFVFGLIFWAVNPETYGSPIYHLLMGYSLIGAFFLAPDSSSSPYTPQAMIMYGIGAGVLTMIIRYWGAWGDGVVWAILFFNALTPMLDRIHTRRYGLLKKSA